MYLPEELQGRRFAEWNYVVKGLVEMWELARWMGMEEEYEALLRADQEGTMTDLLARIGNECTSLAQLLSLRMEVRQPDPEPAPEPWDLDLPPTRLFAPLIAHYRGTDARRRVQVGAE